MMIPLASKILSHGPEFLYADNKPTRAQIDGRRFEAKAFEKLTDRYGENFVPHLWFVSQTRRGTKLHQPDGLLFDIKNGTIHIIEIKTQFKMAAVRKLRETYLPVVRRTFGFGFEYATVLVCRWYDPTLDRSGAPRFSWPDQVPVNSFGIVTNAFRGR